MMLTLMLIFLFECPQNNISIETIIEQAVEQAAQKADKQFHNEIKCLKKVGYTRCAND